MIKIACHFHSNWSYDANWNLKKIRTVFKKIGYDAILMTEHDISFDNIKLRNYIAACKKNSINEFLFIPGIEYSDKSNRTHVMVWGDLPFLGVGNLSTDLLAYVKEKGGVSVLSHPSRRNMWIEYNPKWDSILNGIEIWNRKYDGLAPSNEALSMIKKNNLLPFVGMDFHTFYQFMPLQMISSANDLNKNQILKSIKEKNVYPQFISINIGRINKLYTYKPILKCLEIIRRTLAKKYRKLTK